MSNPAWEQMAMSGGESTQANTPGKKRLEEVGKVYEAPSSPA